MIHRVNTKENGHQETLHQAHGADASKTEHTVSHHTDL